MDKPNAVSREGLSHSRKKGRMRQQGRGDLSCCTDPTFKFQINVALDALSLETHPMTFYLAFNLSSSGRRSDWVQNVVCLNIFVSVQAFLFSFST